jgi:hypothetical protein
MPPSTAQQSVVLPLLYEMYACDNKLLPKYKPQWRPSAPGIQDKYRFCPRAGHTDTARDVRSAARRPLFSNGVRGALNVMPGGHATLPYAPVWGRRYVNETSRQGAHKRSRHWTIWLGHPGLAWPQHTSRKRHLPPGAIGIRARGW